MSNKTVPIGPFDVADASSQDIIERLANADGQHIAYALHVGGLNKIHDRDFVDAMRSAGTIYADGIAPVLLAKLGGARAIQRSSTTDIGIPVIVTLAKRLQRPVRIAIVGGKPGVAEQAGFRIEKATSSEICLATHGYHRAYHQILQQILETKPDILIVGMGMPAEAHWVESNRTALPDCLIMTCGGWLGFLTGAESRAPKFLQAAGLEWLYRLAQSPRRLFKRYLTGVRTVFRLIPQQRTLRK